MKRNRDRRDEEGQGQDGWTGTETGGIKKNKDRDRWDEEEQRQEG
jgi:hypothetical protein